jgi:hypothetical protein
VSTTNPGTQPGPAAAGPTAPGNGQPVADFPAPGQAPAAGAAPAATAPAAGGLAALGLPQLTRILGAIVAPTTLLTSLLFYFGWSHAYYFFDHFGVNSTLLGLTTRDYVQRSLDGLFVPLIVVACAGLVVLWGHASLRARLAAGARPPVLRTLVPVLAAAGLLLAVGGVWSVFAPTLLSAHLVAAPLCLAFGVLLLMYALHLHRSLAAAGRPERAGAAVAEWAAVFVLVGLSLFWAASDYSAAVGRSRARHFVATVATYPGAVLYSSKSLSLTAPGVREIRCQDPDAAYRYRYDGLKLVLQSGDQYLFLPDGWTPRNGVAILMPRSDSLRLELVPASVRAPAQRAAC